MMDTAGVCEILVSVDQRTL